MGFSLPKSIGRVAGPLPSEGLCLDGFLEIEPGGMMKRGWWSQRVKRYHVNSIFFFNSLDYYIDRFNSV